VSRINRHTNVKDHPKVDSPTRSPQVNGMIDSRTVTSMIKWQQFWQHL
jgi:hypothetical protein